MKHRLTFFFFLYLIGLNSFGQLGSWNIITAKYTFSQPITIFGEAQIRSLHFYDHFHYFEYKTGVLWNVTENFSFGPIVGHYRTYSAGGNFETPIQSDEIRTSMQFLIKQSIGIVKLEHRYRIEQRYTNNGYRNRFRYRFNLLLPIVKFADHKKLSFNIWEEIFFTNNAPYFERNRFYAGFNFQLSESSSVYTGYVHQLDYNLLDETGRDFFQIGFQLDLH